MANPKTLFLAARPQFLPAIAAPVALGAAVAWRSEGRFSVLVFVLTLVAALSVHAGMNVLNDYFDSKNNADELNRTPLTPFAGGSRFIQKGLLTQGTTLRLGLALAATGALIGLYLAWAVAPWLLAVGAIGLFSGYFYSAPPLFLAGRGLGEATVALNFGLLTVAGSCMAQTGGLSAPAVVASLPSSFLIAAILYINQFPDLESDRLAGKRNLVVRMGARRARYGLAILVALSCASLAAGAVLGYAPILSLAALVAAVPAFAGSIGLIRHYDDAGALVPSIKAVILSHTATGLLQAASFLI